jgi:imidazolonepropionase-like amidohydrolase
VVGGMLIDGHGGAPIHHSVILIENDTIKAIGTVSTLEVPAGAKVIDARGKTVMPGLIDLHSHVDIVGAGVYDDWHPVVKERFKEILPASEKHQLMAGVVIAREPGGFLESDLWVRDSINRGEIHGARRLVSGPYINYGDPKTGDSGPHGTPTGAYHHLNVNTPELAREAAIYLLDAGVDLIKAYNRLTEPMVRAICEEVHKRGKHVAAHVHDDENLDMRLRAGIDSIEHLGVGRSGATTRYKPETLELWAESRAPSMPCLSKYFVYRDTERFPERLEDPDALRFFPVKYQNMIRESIRNFSHLRYFDGRGETREDLPRLFRQVLEAGIPIYLGTEAGTPLNFHANAAAREMIWMHRLGMPAMDVILASTRGPARFLRIEERYGSIQEGKIADVIAVDGNPLYDMDVMHNVSVVIKDGWVYKGTAVPNEQTDGVTR